MSALVMLGRDDSHPAARRATNIHRAFVDPAPDGTLGDALLLGEFLDGEFSFHRAPKTIIRGAGGAAGMSFSNCMAITAATAPSMRFLADGFSTQRFR